MPLSGPPIRGEFWDAEGTVQQRAFRHVVPPVVEQEGAADAHGGLHQVGVFRQLQRGGPHSRRIVALNPHDGGWAQKLGFRVEDVDGRGLEPARLGQDRCDALQDCILI